MTGSAVARSRRVGARLREAAQRHPNLVAFAVLLLVAAVAFGSYVTRGGFVHDDWSIAETYRHNAPGLLNGLLTGLETAGRHPVSGLYTGFVHEVFGLHQGAHLAWIAFMGAVTSLLLFAVLRALGCGAVLSLVVAVLVLLFPASDAGRLWVSGAGWLAVLLVLAGLLLALHGLRPGVARAAVWHVGAAACYVAAILTYDVALVALLGTGLIYRLRAPWRRVWYRWAADVTVAVAGALYVRGGTSKTVEASGSALGARFQETFDGSRQLLASLGGSLGLDGALFPIAWPAANAALLAGALVLAVGLWRGRRDRGVRVTALMGVYGLLVVTAASAVLLVVEYRNMSFGIFNRVNVLAGVGYVLVLVAIPMTAYRLTVGPRLGRTGAAVAALIVCVVLGGLFVARLRVHQDVYVASVQEQQAAIDVLAGIAPPPPSTVVYVSGVRGEAGPGVPVFQATWDLTGALRILWETRQVDAVPAGTLTALRCRPDGVLPEGPLFTEPRVTPYRSALFVDVSTGKALRAHTQEDCRQAARWFTDWLRGT